MFCPARTRASRARSSSPIRRPPRSKAAKVIVEGVNVATKHQKPRKQGEEGGIIKVETPIYASKVQLVCPKCGKATRVGHKVEGDKKVRVCKKCGAEI